MRCAQLGVGAAFLNSSLEAFAQREVEQPSPPARSIFSTSRRNAC